MHEIRGRKPINCSSFESPSGFINKNLSDTESDIHGEDSVDAQTDITLSPPKAREKQSSYKQYKNMQCKTRHKKEMHVNIWFSIAVVTLFAFFMFMMTFKLFTTKAICSFDELRNRYPIQNSEIWESLSIGIENILNKKIVQSAVYLFVHQEGEHVHDLMNEIITHSAQCFDKSPTEMTIEDFNTEDVIGDYGYAIEKYKMKSKNNNVISIVNLNQIPSKAARALHTICDTHSPIVKEVVIFLNVMVPTSMKSQKPAKQAELTLRGLWGLNLDKNVLNALITRLTDQVLPIVNL